MRKIWLLLIVAFVFVTMGACASMYSKGERVFRARGTVASYEPGKAIKLKPGYTDRLELEGANWELIPPNANLSEFEYAIVPDTEVKGSIQPGKRVLIRYTKAGPEGPTQKTARSIDAVFD